MEGKDTVKKAVLTANDAIIDKKGENTVVLDISGISVISDYFIITTGNNVNHVRTLAEAVEEKLAKTGCLPKHIEGRQSSRWILLDYGDFVVNIFGKEEREFYNIEHIWGDASLVKI